LILGLPGEDEAALRRSLDFCLAASLRTGVNLSLHLVNPQPGCGLGEEFGARARQVEGIPPDMAFGAGETAAERALIAAHPDLFTTWALLPDQEEHLRFLHALAKELPELLERYPRTFDLLRVRHPDSARTGRALDVLDLWRAWKASAKSFESFALGTRDTLVIETLRWEQAQLRVAAGAGARAARIGPCRRGELLRCTNDLSLLGRSPSSARIEERETWLAIVPRERGVRTLRVSADVAQLLGRLDGQRELAQLQREHPGIEPALGTLAEAGLIDLA